MNKKILLVILGVLAGIALLVSATVLMKGLASYSTVKMKEVVNVVLAKVRTTLETAREDLAYAQAWTPPADTAGDEVLFPVLVGGYQYAGSSPDAPHLLYKNIPGRFGIYANASGRIIVSVYRANELEKEAIYTRMITHVEKLDGGTRTQYGNAASYKYAYSFTEPRYETGAFWWSKGWLVYLRSDNRPELAPFLKTYLEAIKGKGM